jgi:uncharacterized protein (DUF486 family)
LPISVAIFRRMNTLQALPFTVQTVLLLIGSNIFMTFA